ncbi:hypothetical protein EDB81DRAFT_902968 [Dactylonectria macrodidyma]|uniref:Uncharacterized protein n=1 Tax=Dactylonectria macrodidyma TaxID=307937 RepID=A0A9P9EBI2_9HYPO|nr:hypothetical protein EDB81DRAFT_902968 [Dactylonectria macrodidyma]
MTAEHQDSNNGVNTDDLNSIERQALVHLFQTKVLGVATPNYDFPQELNERKAELEKSFCKFMEGFYTRCKPQIQLKSPPAPTRYQCPFCEYESCVYDDWKNKHLLCHEKNLGRRWHCKTHGLDFKKESEFYKHHRRECSHCEERKGMTCDGLRRGKNKQPCSCVRCHHAKRALVSMEVWHACGFCMDYQVFNCWEDYCSHLRVHFQEGTPKSVWSYSRVIYALICRLETLSQAFANEGPVLLYWRMTEETEKLRQDLQSYNGVDRCGDLAREAYRLTTKPDDPRFLVEPRNSPTSILGGGYQLASRHSADPPRINEGVDLVNPRDPFTGHPDETLPPSTTIPHVRDILSARHLAHCRTNLHSECIPTTPAGTNLEYCGELPSQGFPNFSSNPEGEMLWMALVCNSPEILNELQSRVGSHRVKSMITSYLSAGGSLPATALNDRMDMPHGSFTLGPDLPDAMTTDDQSGGGQQVHGTELMGG